MATTTTNFGWDIPQSTDLVKDGATAIAALGQDIDTALVDLKGGTTGQILAKASNTDLDYTWTSPTTGDITAVTAGTGISGGGTSGDVTITNSMATAIDAKGDLIAGTGADAFSRLAVGANNTILTADSTTATGLKWAAPASTGALTLITRSAFSGSTSVTVDSVFNTTYDTYCIIVEDCQAVTGADDLLFQFRFGSTTRNTGYYGSCGTLARSSTTWGNAGSVNAASLTVVVDIGGSGGGLSAVTLWVNQVGQSTQRGSIRGSSFNGANFDPSVIGGGCDSAETFTGFVLSAASNITGTVAVYGVAK